jgi:hypothetical protein
VSSDPFADLADSLDGFCSALRGLMNQHRLPLQGSPALAEAEGAPFTGEWGQNPSLEVFASVYLTAWSCADHLAATASVLRARRGPAALYTLVRASAESAAIACHLTDCSIDARERLRRNMNCHLDALCEQVSLLDPFSVPEAAPKVAGNRERIAAIGRAGKQHGFTFHKMDGWRPAYLGKKPPSATTLIDTCTSRTPGLGAASQRLLSSVTHAKLHGLSRFLVHDLPGPGGSAAGDEPGQINASAGSLAMELQVGPMCASSLAEGLCWFAGWDIDQVTAATTWMLHTWGRIAGVPYPGPELR